MDQYTTEYEKQQHRLQKPPPRQHSNQPPKVKPVLDVDARPQQLPAIPDVPWNFYDAICDLSLGENVKITVAQERSSPCNVVSIQRFKGDGASRKVDMIRRIKHNNFVRTDKIYKAGQKYYVVFEHMYRSLVELAANPLLRHAELVAIVGQIVEGLQYLDENGLQHGHLTCSQVHMNLDGEVKLCGQEYCTDQKVPGKNIKDLGHIMTQLMQGYPKEGPNIGLDNPDEWDTDAVAFLSSTTSTMSYSQLLKHPFLQSWQNKRSWHKERLKGLIWLGVLWTTPIYELY